MSLGVNSIEKVVLIFEGDYISEIYRAEDIVKEFARVPEEDHEELIRFIIWKYAVRPELPESKFVSESPQVTEEDVSLVLDSDWGTEFRKGFKRAIASKMPLRESADVVCSAMGDADDLVQRIAILFYLSSNMNTLHWCTVSMIMYEWHTGYIFFPKRKIRAW